MQKLSLFDRFIELLILLLLEMPWNSVDELPASFNSLNPTQKRKAMSIANRLLSDGKDEGSAIRIAISQAKKMSEGLEQIGDVLLQLLDVEEVEEVEPEVTEAHKEEEPVEEPKARKKAYKASERKLPEVLIEEVVSLSEEQKTFVIRERLQLIERADPSGTVWDVRCIEAGTSKNRTQYSESVLKESVGLFSGVPCFADHGDGSRSVRDVVGWFESPRMESDGIHAEFHALESTPWFLGPMKEAYERGKADLIGFSINGEGSRHVEKINDELVYVVDKIRAIESVDGVINPSAGGQVVKLVASQSSGEQEELMTIEQMSLEELRTTRPDLYDQIAAQAKADMTEALNKVKEQDEQARQAEAEKVKAEEAKAQEAALAEQTKLQEQQKTDQEKSSAESVKLQEQIAKLQEEMAIARSERKLQECMDDSGLPKVIKDKLMRQFSGRTFQEDELKAAMDEEENILKALQDERPTSYPSIQTGESQRDRAVKALEGLIKGEDVGGIKAARTIREAYALFKGLPTWADVDAHEVLRESWAGKYTEGNERLREGVSVSASVFTSWGEVLSEYIHKRLLELYRMPYLDDWRRVVSSVVAIPDFKTQRRIRVGGYPNFASVGEDVAYNTIVTPTDEEATYKVTKYGQIEKLTMEAIANDDVGAIRRIPFQLSRAAKRTVYEKVLDLMYKNGNVTYAAEPLINSASHANSLVNTTVDVDLGDASLAKAKRLLIEQTEKDSSKPLGLRGRFLIIPPELEPVAIRLHDNEFAAAATGLQGETAGSVIGRERDVNVHRNSFEYMVVPTWADSGAWYLVADPADTPTIEVGFYQGRQEPELFVQDLPNVGSNFDRDEIQYKSRIIFGSVVLDHRGFIGSSEEVHT